MASLQIILPILVSLSWIYGTNAQITTACSSSMISSFTPCLNFVTGSSGSGSSPTRDCCDALKSLIVNNMDCACLIITGNVPVSIPFINANLGSALPRACKSSVPMQCKSSGVPLPAPGPVLFTPPAPPAAAPVHDVPAATPLHAHAPKGSKAATAAAPPPAGSLDIAPAPSSTPKFPLGPGANPGIRPVVNPSSAASNLFAVSLPYLVLMFAGIIAFKFF
ncbi:non-specific lipid transfer protein GPI-anchored 16-like [Salvia miltiorrhiza]|uniref:non-specific lipid transfer protein GPI-anchored 16-like n=1 Tax=Salvia miltiorrhiza TaxID=226208 RepID=UPI0025AD7A89|nr:non-specific lipid transfer protein GPI-anchored 16-like [Salvia miltiorrhiza]